MRLDAKTIAKALGGEAYNGKDGPYVIVPGPGHSPTDRSLSILFKETAPAGAAR